MPINTGTVQRIFFPTHRQWCVRILSGGRQNRNKCSIERACSERKKERKKTRTPGDFAEKKRERERYSEKEMRQNANKQKQKNNNKEKERGGAQFTQQEEEGEEKTAGPAP